MWIGEQEVDLHVVVDGKTIKQVNSFVYLGGTVCQDGGSSKEIQRRVQAGAAAWRRVEGFMWDRKLKKQLKGKVLEACVVTACIYGLGTLALTERQEEKMQIAEQNWVRRICKVTKEDRREMKELRGEIDMKKNHLKKKVAGSRMRWAGDVQRMGEDRLSKRAWKAEEGGRRRRGRPNLRRKDCVKRYLERAGTNGQEWKTIAEDRGRWTALTTKVEKLPSDLDPTPQGSKGKKLPSDLDPTPQGSKGKKKKKSCVNHGTPRATSVFCLYVNNSVNIWVMLICHATRQWRNQLLVDK